VKTFYAILLFLLIGFVSTDVFRLATLWSNYRPKDIAIHSIFAVGTLLISGANGYFMLVRTPTRISAHAKLLLSFFTQLVVIAAFSQLTISAWKGYLFEAGSSTALRSNSQSIGILLLLLPLMAGLLIWSAKQSKYPTSHSTGSPPESA